MKLGFLIGIFDVVMSHPTRVRGLKPVIYIVVHGDLGVAPHAGAWIETTIVFCIVLAPLVVAPHAGAWIETSPA